MFDFDEIEEVAPAAARAVGSNAPAQVKATDAAAAGPAAGGAAPEQAGADDAPGPVQESGQAPGRASAVLLTARRPDEKAFEEAAAARSRWQAAAGKSRDLRAELGRTGRDALREALRRAEEDERACEQLTQAAEKKAADARQDRELQIEREVAALIHAAEPVDVPELKTPWLPFGSEPDVAEVRLYAFFGAGKQASGFRQWVDLAKQTCPNISVCPVELPGKGQFPGETMGDAHEVAEAFVRDVLDPLLRDGRPFALLGFSIGARLCYEIARRRRPLRLYVAGRAAPHVGAAGSFSELGIPMDPTDFLTWVIAQKWGTESFLERILEHSKNEADPQSYLQKYAKPIRDDITIGQTPVRDTDLAGQVLPFGAPCQIRVYESKKDATWPPAVISSTWDYYGPSPGGRCPKKSYPNLSHDDLCSQTGSPLLKDVLHDLHELLYTTPPPE